ncbi:CBS domain-containing protein [Enhygromyxa salina]|uniref:Inosine 5'-monophosphate dehydrogenase n=1 Tax=Enhygromyxa salina TaxID=215803 RepID=A0A2S9YPQ9_9BACT|nr:CBS domain-containing protein [Enhygromyxa salina]PRQ07084.1 inosine 5'-monophosphate dehydrogenase [Enhygromyxa salina]
MTAEAIMTRSVLTVKPDTTVRDAIRLIEDSDIRHLPVVDGTTLVGILSDRDLREYRIPVMLEIEYLDEADRDRANDILDTPVSEAMNSDMITVDSAESISDVIAVMIEYKIGAVPVVDRTTEELVGIISYVDVLSYTQTLLDVSDRA